MEAPPLHEWSDFLVAEVGASAALAGLLMVAISINLARILAYPQLPGRAAESLLLLIGAMIEAALLLIPAQPAWAIGAEIIVPAALVNLWGLSLTLRVIKHDAQEHFLVRVVQRIALTQAATLPSVIGGIVAMGGDLAGIYGAAAGILMSLLVGAANSWVLLVEIQR